MKINPKITFIIVGKRHHIRWAEWSLTYKAKIQ
jgi:hypothetical protein